MKKLTALLIAVLTCFALVGCVSSNDKDAAPGMSLAEMMDAVNKGVDLMDVGNIELDSENFSYYAFVDYKDGYEGLASEAMNTSVAHSVVLVKVPEGEDVQAVAAQMKANADPRKWICVEAEKTVVAVKGNVIMLCMSFAGSADAILANFNKLS